MTYGAKKKKLMITFSKLQELMSCTQDLRKRLSTDLWVTFLRQNEENVA